jgi:ATP-dependent RNA helicase SUPV3L1/SUV3
MGLKPEQLAPTLNVLGFRLFPAQELGDKYFGPPAPAMLGRRKQEHHQHQRQPAAPARKPERAKEPEPVVVDADNPFAALAALKVARR